MAIVGNLFVNLRANTAAFGRGMDKARSKSKSSMGAIAGNLKKIGIAAGVMGAAAVAGFALLIKKSADAADKLGKLSESTGISVEKLSALGFAAEQSGVDMDFVAARMVNLARRAKEADRGVLSYAIAFKKLGVELRDNDGNLKATDDLLLEVADGFSGMEDGTLKAALATDIFSNQGVALIPLLNKGSAGIREMMEEGRIFGQVISTETAIAAQEFNDNLDKLKSAATGLANTVLAELSPQMVTLTGNMVDFVKESGGIPALGEKISRAFLKMAIFASGAATNFEIATIGAGALGQALFQLALKGIIFAADEIDAIIREGLVKMGEAAQRGSIRITNLAEAVKKLGTATGDDGAGGNVENLLTKMEKAAIKASFLARIVRHTGDAHEFFSQKLAKAIALQKEELEAFANAPQLFADTAAEARFLLEALGEIPTRIDGLGSSLTAIPPKLELLRDVGEQFTTSLSTGFSDLLVRGGRLSDLLQRLASNLAAMIAQAFILRALGGIFGGLFGGFAGGGKVGGGATVSSVAGAPGFQAGGRTPINAPILVGERGPELFVPDTAGRIVPNENIGGITIIVNAQGGDAATEMHVRRGIAEGIKEAVAISQINIIDRAQRGG